MHLLFNRLIFGEVNTISIPTDTIFVISLLVIFIVVGFFFNKIVSNEMSQINEKKDFDCNLELEDHLTLQAKILDKKNVEKLSNKKQNSITTSKFLEISSLIFFVMGGASLLGIQQMHKSYQGMKASRTNIKLENQSKEFPLSIVDLKPLDETQSNIKKINYIDPLFRTIKQSKNNHFYHVKQKQIENNFPF